MNTTQLEYFIELAYTLSYTKASELLDIAQPTLSKAMNHLEEELGFALFERKGRSVILSEKGEAFLPYAEKTVSTLNEGIFKAEHRQTQITIGALTSVQYDIVAKLVSEYTASHPDVIFSVVTDQTSGLYRRLIRHEIDLALCGGETEDSQIASFPVCRQKLYAALYKGHRLENRTEITFEDLKNEKMILHSRGVGMRRLFDSLCAISGFTPRISAEADEDIGVLGLTEKKIGISIVSESSSLPHNRLVYVPFHYEGPARYVYAAYRKQDSEHLKSLLTMLPSYDDSSDIQSFQNII